MNNINKIVIVGGGSSGWITASSLVTKFPEYDITLIESSDIPTIGVGESTLPSFTHYKNILGLVDSEWMPACNATYKLSIDFTNWDGKNSRAKLVFQDYDTNNTTEHKIDDKINAWFCNNKINNSSVESFTEYFMPYGSMLNSNTKFEVGHAGFSLESEDYYAYHIDAGLFGDYIKQKFKNKIHHIVAEVTSIDGGDGEIKSITLNNNRKVTADLFIDCSGFKRILASKAGQELIKVDDVLQNDSAIATRVPYLDKQVEMEHSTNATTLSSGWVWNIPLYNRIGTGYVYSSKFQSRESALKEFKDHIISTRKNKGLSVPEGFLDDLNYFDVTVLPQATKTPWTKNVVSIGLSGGFIEPLGSTGLHLTIQSALKLVETLGMVGSGVTNVFRQYYNEAIYSNWTGFVNYISLHFALCKRYDTTYWKYISDTVNYKDISLLTELETRYRKMFAAQFGFNPIDKDSIDINNLNRSISLIEEKIQKNREEVKNLSTHYKYLKDNIYNGQ